MADQDDEYDTDGDFISSLLDAIGAMSPRAVNDIDPQSMIADMNNPPESFKEIKAVMWEHHNGGQRAWLMFQNGYGASIIKTSFSYGSSAGLWELAVMKRDGITYETPITNGVIGSCDESEILSLCKRIHALPNAHA
jgi:hypothetical protein